MFNPNNKINNKYNLEFKGVSISDLDKSQIEQIDINSVKLFKDETLEYSFDTWEQDIKNRRLDPADKLTCWFCQSEYRINTKPTYSTLYAPFTIPVCINPKDLDSKISITSKGLFCGFVCAYNYNLNNKISSTFMLKCLLNIIEKNLTNKEFKDGYFYKSEMNPTIVCNMNVTLYKYGGSLQSNMLTAYLNSQNIEYYKSIDNNH